jgi:hypothetical protein
MLEPYLLYSSLTSLALGLMALVLSIVLHLKSKTLSRLPKNLTPNVFNKTFVIFNPFSAQKKMIHTFLSVLPFIVGFSSIGLALILLFVLSAGLFLSFIITIVGLNLIVLEQTPETYQNSTILVNAIQNRSNMGVGDLRVLHVITNLVRRLRNYYLVLSALFFALSAALPHVGPSAIWLFASFMGSILQISAYVGPASYILATFLYALPLVFIQIAAAEAKNRLFGHAS